MLVFRHSSKKHRKEFANHFVLLLQFHESRNAAERETERNRESRRERQRQRERERVGGESRGDGEKEVVSGINRSW